MNTVLMPPELPSLSQQLAQVKAGAKNRLTPERLAIIEGQIAQLQADGISRSALQAGAAAPALTLPDATGRAVSLASLWANGPLIVVFYRGGWCPYCNLGLREWQRLLPQVQAAGATLVAISPQTPDNSLSTSEKNALAYTVLSDSALAAARGFGLLFDFPPALSALYQVMGNDLPLINGNQDWSLPLPATYVVGTDGLIRYAHVEADYRERAEPAQVLAALH